MEQGKQLHFIITRSSCSLTAKCAKHGVTSSSSESQSFVNIVSCTFLFEEQQGFIVMSMSFDCHVPFKELSIHVESSSVKPWCRRQFLHWKTFLKSSSCGWMQLTDAFSYARAKENQKWEFQEWRLAHLWRVSISPDKQTDTNWSWFAYITSTCIKYVYDSIIFKTTFFVRWWQIFKANET